ncbi:MAG: hypothetical protein R3E12_19050 [Candidatus Eisenbacteria bacterium]|uniref:DUF4398 domain-containing protein n=1 Tax=Eiseniibacteriota bacterium TaxID=2212470 RepID=A0A956M2B6_UNCEI|nr:hypothetical protein [Candidatus Eisenbacteria bacterium]
MTRSLTLCALSVGIVLFGAGCQKPPTEDIDAAKTALEQAKNSEAREYAPDALERVNKQYAALEQELKTQEEKMAFRRKYDQAKTLAASVQTQAQAAQAEGTKAKDAMRVQVETALRDANMKLEQVKAALAAAPTGKGTAADLKMMQQDVADMETNLASVQQLYDQGQYRPAMNKVQSLMASMNDTQNAIEMATTMQAKARTGH